MAPFRDVARPGPALIGVGVGPGDPRHVTLGALETLRSADRIVAPTPAPDAVGRAESVVRQVAPDLGVERLPYVMATGSEARSASAEAAAHALLGWFDAGERVAFVTLGDPNVYSTFSSVAAAVRAHRPGLAIETVPGIMALQDLAARTGTVLVDGTQSLMLVTALDGVEILADVLAYSQTAIAIYKGGRHVPEIAKLLAASGRLDGALLGELMGLAGEQVGPLADHGDVASTYLATVIVPPGTR